MCTDSSSHTVSAHRNRITKPNIRVVEGATVSVVVESTRYKQNGLREENEYAE